MNKLNRRDILRIGGIAVGETALAWLLGARASAFAQTTAISALEWKLEATATNISIGSKIFCCAFT